MPEGSCSMNGKDSLAARKLSFGFSTELRKTVGACFLESSANPLLIGA